MMKNNAFGVIWINLSKMLAIGSVAAVFAIAALAMATNVTAQRLEFIAIEKNQQPIASRERVALRISNTDTTVTTGHSVTDHKIELPADVQLTIQSRAGNQIRLAPNSVFFGTEGNASSERYALERGSAQFSFIKPLGPFMVLLNGLEVVAEPNAVFDISYAENNKIDFKVSAGSIVVYQATTLEIANNPKTIAFTYGHYLEAKQPSVRLELDKANLPKFESNADAKKYLARQLKEAIATNDVIRVAAAQFSLADYLFGTNEPLAAVALFKAWTNIFENNKRAIYSLVIAMRAWAIFQSHSATALLLGRRSR